MRESKLDWPGRRHTHRVTLQTPTRVNTSERILTGIINSSSPSLRLDVLSLFETIEGDFPLREIRCCCCGLVVRHARQIVHKTPALDLTHFIADKHISFSIDDR